MYSTAGSTVGVVKSGRQSQPSADLSWIVKKVRSGTEELMLLQEIQKMLMCNTAQKDDEPRFEPTSLQVTLYTKTHSRVWAGS